ncbi:Protein BUNDLE SHEATH DEFECTIVE 2 [Hirschfeldia incana]|nr:Protein BUNDLE SHEATH DEFECTIVE 2 [Hirschfeldia incana]
MANSLCFLASPPTSCIHSPIKSHIPTNLFSLTSDQNSLLTQKRQVFQTCKSKSFQIQATDGTQTTKSNSILCPNCEGKGAVACSQCKGGGVNLIDHFNGQFKAGDSCWLCSEKKLVLCGDCNGAGFLGGFLSTQDQ